MIKNNGFLVVQKSPTVNKGRYNPLYRGVYRLTPWSMENFKKGFEDPYLSPKYATDDGFIPNLPLAQDVLLQFSTIVKAEDLEILYIRERNETEDMELLPVSGLNILGFDVASDSSPFWSVVDDFPPPDELELQAYLGQLNQNGLFDSVDVARDYLGAYLRRYPEDKESGLVVWEVYLVPQTGD